ncbi:protein phosphatase 2C domain-containing protein [Nocardia heshunensis]
MANVGKRLLNWGRSTPAETDPLEPGTGYPADPADYPTDPVHPLAPEAAYPVSPAYSETGWGPAAPANDAYWEPRAPGYPAAPLAQHAPEPRHASPPADPFSQHDELPTTAPVIGDRIVAQPLPSLAGLPHALPTLRADGGRLGDRWVAAASVAGLTHQAEGSTAQDAYCFMLAHDGSALILAVCDGLGHYGRTSQVGAELLARLCCASAARITRSDAIAYGTEVLAHAIEQANAELLHIQQTNLPAWTPSELHSTLLLCRLPLTPDAGPALFARAGDTVAFLLRDAVYSTVFPPASDAGPTNIVTGPLPHPNPREVLELTAAELDTGALILATDGLANDIFDSPATRDWLAERWAVPCGPHRMLDALRYRRQTSHDDRTAVVAWLHPLTREVDDALDHR